MFAIGSEFETCADVFPLQLGVVIDNLSSLMPDASQPSTSYTVMRMERMHGLPPRLSGSMVMRSE